jgi:hypothetical protein
MRKRALRSASIGLWLVTLLVATLVYAAPASPARLPALGAIADPAIRFDPPASTVDPGAVFVLNVVVDNVTDLGGYQFTVSFNPAVLHVQSVTLGSFLGSTGRTAAPLGPTIDNTAGSFTFGGFSFGTAAGPNGTGTVAQITLQAMAPGSSALTFSNVQLTNTQAQVLGPLTTIPGSVTVAGPTATVTRTPIVIRPTIYLPVLKKALP